MLNILEEDRIDHKKLNRFTKSKEVQGFIQHERSFNRKISEKIIIKEIIKLKTRNDYRDKYDFYIIKSNINTIRSTLDYIEKYQYSIMEQALDRVRIFVSQELKINSNIYFYIGGIDGGFSVYGKDIFVNYIKYFNKIDELIKIISHELFHCRVVPFRNKFRLFLSLDTKKYVYEIFGKILEEGIALLIQHGATLEKDDPVGTITKDKMENIGEKFEVLNNVLLELKERNINSLGLQEIDIYAIGYYMVNFLHRYYGREILESWILKYDYNICVRSYIHRTKREGLSSGFSKETEEWILNL